MGKLKSIICSENFSTESLIVASLKHKLRIVLERNFGPISKLDHSSGFESERLMVESLRLLQNGFASLDIIRGGGGSRCAGKEKEMREIKETLRGDLVEEKCLSQ